MTDKEIIQMLVEKVQALDDRIKIMEHVIIDMMQKK